ncbi:hypothetical protein D3C87_2046830 [compost metagenome]
MPQGLLDKFYSLVDSGLIYETDSAFELTKLGWLWYSNIMFYLMPEGEQNILKKIVFEKLSVSGRDVTRDEIVFTAS